MRQIIETQAWLLGLVPLASFALAVWQFLRTRRRARWGKIKTSCLFTPNTRQDGDHIVQRGPVSLVVEAINQGPGEVTIRALKGQYKDGSIQDIALRVDTKLKQGDLLAKAIMPLDAPGGIYDGFYNDAGVELVDLWFEDTFGRKHKLKNVRKHLTEMR
jgi:hypothetical protein